MIIKNNLNANNGKSFTNPGRPSIKIAYFPGAENKPNEPTSKRYFQNSLTSNIGQPQSYWKDIPLCIRIGNRNIIEIKK